MDRKTEAVEKIDTCRFCRGSGRHSCTGITCGEAVREAEKYYRRSREKERMDKFKESRSKELYSQTVMEALHEVLHVELDEDIKNIRRLYSLDEILEAVLVYDGILGYGEKLVRIIEDIFGVKLLEIDV